MPIVSNTPNRIENPSLTELEGIEGLIAEHHHVTIQFSTRSYPIEILSRVNDLCEQFAEKLKVRFYGHYRDVFDCATLLEIPAAVSLLVDCLSIVTNLEAIKTLRHLKTLSLGVYEMNDSSFLAFPNLRNLTELTLGQAKHPTVDLEPLADFGNLKRLHLTGQAKNIECVGRILSLQRLSLSSIKKSVSLSFVNRIPNLKHLRLILGGRPDLSEIKHSELERLEIIRVLGFENFDPDAFPKLKELWIEDEIRLKNLYFSQSNADLAFLWILNCKTLDSISGLSHLANLNELRITLTELDFDDLIKPGLPSRLETFGFVAKKISQTRAIRKRLDAMGYGEFNHSRRINS